MFRGLLDVCMVGIRQIGLELFAQVILSHSTCKINFFLVFTPVLCFTQRKGKYFSHITGILTTGFWVVWGVIGCWFFGFNSDSANFCSVAQSEEKLDE